MLPRRGVCASVQAFFYNISRSGTVIFYRNYFLGKCAEPHTDSILGKSGKGNKASVLIGFPVLNIGGRDILNAGKNRILIQNEKNRSALRCHIHTIRSQIAGIKNPYAKNRSVYTQSIHTAAAVNIQV